LVYPCYMTIKSRLKMQGKLLLISSLNRLN
jgi:hypothetical protein